MESRTEIISVSKEECEYMQKTNLCGENTMICENEICISEQSPQENYSWLNEITDSVINCEIQSRIITADNLESFVFNNYKYYHRSDRT